MSLRDYYLKIKMTIFGGSSFFHKLKTSFVSPSRKEMDLYQLLGNEDIGIVKNSLANFSWTNK